MGLKWCMWGGQGEQAHCGFPEANYHSNAERLARAGLRVVVVEQTETPELLKIRNEGLKKQGKKMVSQAVRATSSIRELLT